MDLIPDSDFGARVRRRLQDEKVIWLTTSGSDETPQPNPVWFLWEGDNFLVYNAHDAKRLEHVAVRPHVSLNFNSNEQGGNVVVFAGVAEQALDVPTADQNPDYLAKYQVAIEQLGMNNSQFAQKYAVPLRMRVTKVRGF